MSQAPFPRLFSPFQIGRVSLRNRIVCLPHATSLGEPSPLFPGDRLIAYYRERAKGGAGLITFSILPANMEPLQRAGIFPADPGPYRRFTDAIHAEGAAIFTQVTHGAGRQVPGPPGRRPPAPLLAPSPVACPNGRQDPHVLTASEIHDLALATGGAAKFARDAGFDGMELHSSHAGYLIQEFLSPASNQRDDEYGGCLENRMRFFREVLEAVRDAVGDSIIVGARLSVDEFIPGGLALEEGVEVACRVAGDGLVDYFSIDGCIRAPGGRGQASVASAAYHRQP
jgi:2,4-dienoyl-CoA reductase-like NADH-dependent reductase (Old Yellow Enzyme family)